MAKRKVKLFVVGDATKCGGCKSEKQFIERNRDRLEQAGITDVVFIDPNSAIGEKYQKKHINGAKAMPLNVVVSGSDDVAFLGFSSKKFLGEVGKATKILGKGDKKTKRGKKKKFGIFK